MIDPSRRPVLDPAPSGDEIRFPPHQAAGLVAPAVDRLYRAAMATARARGGADLSRRYGGPAATGYLIEFRTRLAVPGGTVSGAGLVATTRHQDPAARQREMDKQVAHGMIQRVGDGFTATDRGRSFLADLYELHGRVTAELWSAHRSRVDRLADLAGRLLTAATGSGSTAGATPLDGSFGAVAPPYEPDGTPPGLLLLNRLGALRHHRADAHAAAWTAAGHTPQSITGLAPGPELLAIDLETDRRAAAPYGALAPGERLALLADLAALPG
ncbi:hypothetical protein O7627_35325 [Solwaraspora sp. WMMD1047]|uniref:hypothetical protein n=1 Tax=Solwaraspora sp. WMMD1047 TaxID=3016102 RepID=UPI002417DBEC|nr:hypothetical protein [Solwaraspora sp. WMMD1047]MDG4834542.1 hypothetical protein [Solwaraspora sp. WMMD1047]